MDKETQIKFNFLEEAQGYLDQIESVLLTLNSDTCDPFGLDLVLRSAHSLKGGAGMMGFSYLSQVSHRIEDFFKILKVKNDPLLFTSEVESLLLKGVDALRDIVTFYRQETPIDNDFIENQINPIFKNLRQYLGDLEEDDENALFALEQSSGVELELFEEEVDRLLNQFEQQIFSLSGEELQQGLIVLCAELIVFSQMADIEPFTALSESIQAQILFMETDDLPNFAHQAVNIWKRSHSLVLRGSLDKIPTIFEPEIFNFDTSLNETNWDEIEGFNLDIETEFNLDDEYLTQLQQSESLSLKDVEIKIPQTILNNQNKKIIEPSLTKDNTSEQALQMVRIPVKQLTQFNTIFGKLILERNTINRQLEELKNFASLLRDRMIQLEESQQQLTKWYDRASIEGLITSSSQILTSAISNGSSNTILKESQTDNFDILEMDRYTDLHLISQEQIETIVQLKEVSTDIQLGLLDMQGVIGELNQTTTALQKNITRTQMTPFADVVKVFPRMMRDLSVQFKKQVKLNIKGEGTLIDRSILDKLNSPLNHLLRNAFDHGIESSDNRIAKGKSPQGNITIAAVNRANQTIITIEDDGDGIALQKIKNRLLQQGIPSSDIEKMSEAQILDYIFEPGFSTKDKVTELSGRGVGMDVVKTNLREIRGDIQVKTKEGIGTSFIINIPFSLSVLRVMLLERSGLVFAIPMNSIRELKSFNTWEINTIDNQDKTLWKGENIPVIKLEQHLIFNRPYKSNPLKGNPKIDRSTFVIVGDNDTLGGIYLDRVWGEQEVTVYPIQSPIPLTLGFNNSIILGDGRVIPLIDPSEMLQECLGNSASSIQVDNSVSKLTKIYHPAPFRNHILIVDDSINVRNYLALTLEKAGYQVEEAKDGREAVDKLFNGLSVKAVISDVEMPRLDGYGLLEEVKGKKEFHNLPIIMLTSRSNEKHRKVAFNLGASAYFSKPYNEQELLQKLELLITK
ncbi:signal transduction histidine kinase CheA [Geminocystis sp. NIES-3708]|uniref:hybrid sensor histidine kinase/response regulator n=1 Tax=Geminocystis sp. NIES-3708 TaxID=1615909 RepID=UPI0005FC561E|nr:hybrid sensor histidine kinase/response regulator [Geminocystis sp. NIES-3708]BAQ61590.1 signal transduction histidine kinase CheA [Geminocystis sp. NIES-3708]